MTSIPPQKNFAAGCNFLVYRGSMHFEMLMTHFRANAFGKSPPAPWLWSLQVGSKDYPTTKIKGTDV
jgi:hypothetical protein